MLNSQHKKQPMWLQVCGCWEKTKMRGKNRSKIIAIICCAQIYWTSFGQHVPQTEIKCEVVTMIYTSAQINPKIEDVKKYIHISWLQYSVILTLYPRRRGREQEKSGRDGTGTVDRGVGLNKDTSAVWIDWAPRAWWKPGGPLAESGNVCLRQTLAAVPLVNWPSILAICQARESCTYVQYASKPEL